MVDLWIMATAARLDSLSNCFRADPQVHVVGTAATFPFLRSLMADMPADMALVELQSEMQSAGSHDWLVELAELSPLVLLGSTPDPAVFNRIRRAGPGALLQLGASCEQIICAVKSVAAGLTVFDSAAATQSPGDESPTEELTPREEEVLQLLADGLGNKDIASRLGISEHTIKFHIRSILGKLGAASRTEAVARGLRSGLIEL
jgi:DNA-binding NarL/FixJ family response regulator